MSETVPLRTAGIVAGYGRVPVLHDVDLRIPPRTVTGIIGPNGCGKSTLLKACSGLLPVTTGHVELFGAPLGSLRPRQVARQVAVLPQSAQAPEGMTVADLVLRGRAPHQPWYRSWSPDDAVVAAALADTGVTELRDTPLEELSGGQRQRAWIAMTLAQQTDLLLLDEPTNHLDLAHAVDVMELVARLRRDTGRTVVVVMHDLTMAARYCDHLVVMDRGRVAAEGPPASVLTEDLLHAVFGLRAHVFADPYDALPTVVPVRS